MTIRLKGSMTKIWKNVLTEVDERRIILYNLLDFGRTCVNVLSKRIMRRRRCNIYFIMTCFEYNDSK